MEIFDLQGQILQIYPKYEILQHEIIDPERQIFYTKGVACHERLEFVLSYL